MVLSLLGTLGQFKALNAPSLLMCTGSDIISPKRGDHPLRDRRVVGPSMLQKL